MIRRNVAVMEGQDIDKLIQTIVFLKEHKVVRNRIDKVVLRKAEGVRLH